MARAPLAQRPASLLAASPPAQVAAGNKHSLAVAWNGSLYSWGRSADGQCGHGDVMRKSVPTLVRHLVESRVRVIAAAAGACCAICVTDRALRACLPPTFTLTLPTLPLHRRLPLGGRY